MVPPPLAWVPLFVKSMERAMGIEIAFEMEPTVNPLIYQVVLRFNEHLDRPLDVWNMFQIWAAKNDSIPYGKIKQPNSRTMILDVIIKRRLGVERDEIP